MASFRNDYSYLAHPRIISALTKYSSELNVAYGLDYHSENAAKYIRDIFACKEADVHFLAGGTQTNMTFISYCLKGYEGVISSDTGHIHVHETASVEGSGHKIILVPNVNGKVSAKDVERVMKEYNNEHMVKPRMVYISNSTEIGSIYFKEELVELSSVCKKYGLYLFMDGARLGAALASNENDLEPSLIGSLVDAFYVGGTKNGAMFGEAFVITNPHLKSDFRYHIKNKGAMLAKGYAVGIQFEELFKDGLYFEIVKSINEMGQKLKEVLSSSGYKLLPSPTNQIFVTLPLEKGLDLLKKFDLEIWNQNEEEITVRFVTSFLTKIEDINEVKSYLDNL